jgi:hypothetical protein
VRAEVERRVAIRKEWQGRLLCEVQVLVYERDVDEGTEMMVAFPDGAVLGVASDRGEIAAAVARARSARKLAIANARHPGCPASLSRAGGGAATLLVVAACGGCRVYP